MGVHRQQDETRFMFLTLTNTNSKWIKNLNVRLEILKFIEENTSKILKDTGRGKAVSTAQEGIPCSKGKHQQEPTEWEKIRSGYTAEMLLIFSLLRTVKISPRKINIRCILLLRECRFKL